MMLSLQSPLVQIDGLEKELWRCVVVEMSGWEVAKMDPTVLVSGCQVGDVPE
jgi:hypothetical protein